MCLSQAVCAAAESGLLVNYYGLPSVSLRDVWFHKFARNQYGFRCRDVMCGNNHPNLLGHQCAPLGLPTHEASCSALHCTSLQMS